jgi:hypothetical protein
MSQLDEYKEYKATPEEGLLVKCDECDKSVYADNAVPWRNQAGELEGYVCDECYQKEHDQWMDYFNQHGHPLDGDITDVEVIEVLDRIDSYTADVAIEFECNGKRYSACAVAMYDGCGGWDYDPNGDLSDVEEIKD